VPPALAAELYTITDGTRPNPPKADAIALLANVAKAFRRA
jgi:hypothetical protein